VPGRGHALTIDAGWQVVADAALDFVRRFAPAGRLGLQGAREPLAGRSPVAKLAVSRAGVTQLAECQLPKLNVAGSNPVSRSTPLL
jgi:hypothetical protein